MSSQAPKMTTPFPPSQTVTFALSGRHTLSENLPPETIPISIHLIQRSPFLFNLFTSNPSRHPIPLPNIDPTAFTYYIQYLSYGHITYIPAHTSLSTPLSFPSLSSLQPDCQGLQLRDCIDLIFAHIAGGRMQEPQFQDEVLKEMDRVLDSAQSPAMRVLETLILEDGVGEELCRFVIGRMFLVERRMLGLLRGAAAGESGNNGMWVLGNLGRSDGRREERDVAEGRAPSFLVPSEIEVGNDGQIPGPQGIPETPQHAPRRSITVGCKKPLPIVPSLSVSYGAPSKSPDTEGIFLQQTRGLAKKSPSYEVISTNQAKERGSGNVSFERSCLPSSSAANEVWDTEISRALSKSAPSLMKYFPDIKQKFSEYNVTSASSVSDGRLQRNSTSSRPATGLCISRKPEPARGPDWLDQYDRLNVTDTKRSV